jgi:mono/diheme cytochrome c family protein
MMRKLGFLVLTFLLACSPDVDALKEKESGDTEARQVSAPETTAEARPAEPSPATGGVVPVAAPTSLPQGSLRGDAAKGAQIYSLYCSSCHGLTGAGDGPLAASLVPRPANHTDAAYMGSLSDEHLYKVIQGGGAAVGKSPLMAPWGAVVSEEQTRDLIGHLRTLSGT